MKKQNKSAMINGIYRNPLLIPLLLAVLVIAYFVGKNQSIVSNNTATATPTPIQTEVISSPTHAPVQQNNTYQIPSLKQGLPPEERQKLGSYKAQIEEALRKGKEQEDNLRKKIDEYRKQCDDYENTKDECLASISDMEAKLNTLIQENEANAYPLKQKLAEINALLGN